VIIQRSGLPIDHLDRQAVCSWAFNNPGDGELSRGAQFAGGPAMCGRFADGGEKLEYRT
jgi:hypothetical protein